MRTEDQEFEELEKRIGAKTIDLRATVTSKMRIWYRDTFRKMADDLSILAAWSRKEKEEAA